MSVYRWHVRAAVLRHPCGIPKRICEANSMGRPVGSTVMAKRPVMIAKDAKQT